MAVDYSVPLITDIKCAKLLVEVTQQFFFFVFEQKILDL